MRSPVQIDESFGSIMEQVCLTEAAKKMYEIVRKVYVYITGQGLS